MPDHYLVTYQGDHRYPKAAQRRHYIIPGVGRFVIDDPVPFTAEHIRAHHRWENALDWLSLMFDAEHGLYHGTREHPKFTVTVVTEPEPEPVPSLEPTPTKPARRRAKE